MFLKTGFIVFFSNFIVNLNLFYVKPGNDVERGDFFFKGFSCFFNPNVKMLSF
jgi:hypothetical protein